MDNKPWDYDIEKVRRKLLKIKDRYLRQVFSNGILDHHGDCDIYRSIQVYGSAPCTCGLLHDLQRLPDGIALKLRPNLYDELLKMDGEPQTSVNQEECEKILKEAFPKVISPSLQEWEALEYQDWALIEEVFGKPFRDDREFEWAVLEDDG